MPRGQAEAAVALGFSGVEIWRRILLPQALRISVPPLINEFILLLKASSLVSVVGIAELTRVSMNIASLTYRPLEAYVGGGLVLSRDQSLPGGARRAHRAAPGGGARRWTSTSSGATRPRSSAASASPCCAGAPAARSASFSASRSRSSIGCASRRCAGLLRVFIEVFRGTPFLVQLFLLYAGGPYIGLRLSATTAGVLGLGLYSSAYFAEIFRGGFAAVPVGQIEAAMSVGMKPSDVLWRVTLPAALIAAVPPIVNMLIVLSKETVVLSIITVPELMYQMQTMAAETFTAFDAIFAMAVVLLAAGRSRLAPGAALGGARHRLHGRGSEAGVSEAMIEIAGLAQALRRARSAARRRPDRRRIPRWCA